MIAAVKKRKVTRKVCIVGERMVLVKLPAAVECTAVVDCKVVRINLDWEFAVMQYRPLAVVYWSC